jgi:hypothetical protein
MLSQNTFEAIDYLVLGHIAVDLTPKGSKLGGTVAYSGLTARALGLRVGIVTDWGEEIPLGLLAPIPIAGMISEKSTTFENLNTPSGRIQKIHHIASKLDYHLIPEPWRNTSIIHLGPLAQEVEPSLLSRFSDAFIGVTPQGWLREWNEAGYVSPTEWPEFTYVLNRADAAVLSLEDVGGDERQIEEMAVASRLLVVTDAANGAVVYWNGEERKFDALQVSTVDATGSGDIFAAIFFTHYFRTSDPWESAFLATRLATQSTTRPGLRGVPTQAEIQSWLAEVIP